MIRHIFNQVGSFRSALAVALGIPFLIVSSAFAQDPNAPAPAAGTAVTERVIVTGSYLPTAETESALPVTVYTAAVLQKQGANTPVEGLRQLPSFVGNAATENDSNGGNGQATINLRAIGPENVLTMINGRRAFQYSDVNAIPIGGVARTEVLKDGAGAVYGSDAVAGVVNFIMLNGPGEAPYEGAEAFFLYGNTTDTDAHVLQAYLKGGVATDKVSVAAAAEYYSRENLFSLDRPDVAGTADARSPLGAAGQVPGTNPPVGIAPLGRGGLNGASQTFAGRVSVSGMPGGLFPRVGNLVLIDLTNSQVTPASYRRFEPNALSNPPGPLPGEFPAGTDPSRFNFRAFTPAIPKVEKAMYFVTGRYKIFGEGLQIYGDIMYSKTKQDNGLAGAPFLLSNAFNGRTEARASVFNPFGNRLSNVRYRFVQELGLRKSFYDHDYYRYVAGLNGDFNFANNSFISHFGYDTGLVYERFDEQRIDSGDGTNSGIRNEIAPVGFSPTSTGLFNPFIGQGAPTVGLAPTYVNGVPTGLFAPYNNLLGAQNASYLGHSFFYERDWLVDIKLNAVLFPKLWNGGIGVAAGFEHREAAQHSVPDPTQAAGDVLGFNQSPNTKTFQEVDSWFAELNIPIVLSTMNIPFVRSFDISIAWRHEEFFNKDQYTKQTSNVVNINPQEDFYGSPRVSLRYRPFADLTLRASWNQSFRGPSPGELFQPTVQDFPVLFDPVNRVTLQPPEGVWRGGNPNLLPETTDTYSAGLVYTPKWLPGFTITADWYQIWTTNLILSGNDFAQVLLSTGVIDPDGFGGGTNDPAAPGGPGLGATYDPVTGELLAVDSQTGNAGKRLVQGLDVTAVYEIPTQNLGKFTFSVGWNHFFTWKASANPAVGAHNFLGNYNNGTFPLAPGAIPFNKGFIRGEWEWKNFDFIATVNYIGDFEDDENFIFGNVNVPARGTDDLANPSFTLHHRVSSYETLDLQLSYEFVKPSIEPIAAGKDFSKDGKSMAPAVAGVETASIWKRMLWGTTLRAGVNNAFDRYPPTVLGAFNDNYDTSLYSIRNRYWYVAIKKAF